MTDQLIIVFAKNCVLGAVKTRLAKTEGDDFAYKVYQRLLDITEHATLAVNSADIHVYFTHMTSSNYWTDQEKFLQSGANLGERMSHAFQQGFSKGYKRIIGIGTDLPDLTEERITQSFELLKNTDTVFGPANDGGYYLLGMNTMIPEIFKNKPWSTDQLLQETLEELKRMGKSVQLMEVLNDIDTIDDLNRSWLGKELKEGAD
jgi:rSAM/selenodomain-associated transferase 1